MNQLAKALLLAPAVAAIAGAQTVMPPDTLHVGCVMAAKGGKYTLCEGDLCSFVSGTDVNAKLAGHVVTLRGTLHEVTKDGARSIVVTSIVSVGEACHETCLPRTPGGRGAAHYGKQGSVGVPSVKAPPQ